MKQKKRIRWQTLYTHSQSQRGNPDTVKSNTYTINTLWLLGRDQLLDDVKGEAWVFKEKLVPGTVLADEDLAIIGQHRHLLLGGSRCIGLPKLTRVWAQLVGLADVRVDL